MIRLEKVLKMSGRRLQNVLTRRLEDVLKTSWRLLENVLKTSSRCFEDVFTRRLQNVFKTFWRRLDKTSWIRLEDVLKTYDQDEYIGLDQDVLKKSSEDICVRWIYSSWSRRLEDVLKTSSEDEDERRLQDVFIKTNVCWEYLMMVQKQSSKLIVLEIYSECKNVFLHWRMERKQFRFFSRNYGSIINLFCFNIISV